MSTNMSTKVDNYNYEEEVEYEYEEEEEEQCDQITDTSALVKFCYDFENDVLKFKPNSPKYNKALTALLEDAASYHITYDMIVAWFDEKLTKREKNSKKFKHLFK